VKCFIQLSKIGDILSILPILYREYQTTLKKPVLMIHRDFTDVLAGVSYVEPWVFNGAYDDLKGAITKAKKQFSEVVVLQTHGNIPIEQTTPSFQFDQWKRAGCADKFEEWPLLIDQRDMAREMAVQDKVKRPYILFGDHSQSSPFLHKEELATMLKTTFPNHAIVRLSEVKAGRFTDLLGLFDNAACLVTIETAYLHLSKASSVPTVALAANGWRGSAFHRKFVFYCRYNEWERRKLDLIDVVKKVVNHEIQNPLYRSSELDLAESNSDNNIHGYNPSIIKHDDKILSVFRAHTRHDWRTELFFNNKLLKAPVNLAEYSLEDCRLFEFNDRLYGAYVVSTSIDGLFRSYMAYGQIEGNEIGHIQPHYAGNDFRGMTKNWLPFIHDSKLHFIYGIKGKEQITLCMDFDQVRAEYRSPAPTWAWGEIRGGAIVPHGDNFLRFFHSRQDYGNRALRYFIGASIIEAKPPFRTLAVSSKPIIEGDERWTANVKHWKANVAIIYGAIVLADGKYLLSYGRNDCECCFAELTEHDLNL